MDCRFRLQRSQEPADGVHAPGLTLHRHSSVEICTGSLRVSPERASKGGLGRVRVKGTAGRARIRAGHSWSLASKEALRLVPLRARVAWTQQGKGGISYDVAQFPAFQIWRSCSGRAV